ncbi:MAG: DegT/DnrJ/EryC1/StrS family aminotransferase [Tepidisphaeraceae bacterium]|jgi:dTDP-4-amino-4,6-dideoxygalactose transaminase
MISAKKIQSHPAAPQKERIDVPLSDLRTQNDRIMPQIMEEVRQVVENSSFILGPKTVQFEEDFARYCGAAHCIGVNSGTSALHLALICAGVGPGDEVITVPMTFIATSWAISYCGARPVFVDVDSATGTMDPALVERAITPRTKAILPVHLYGQPADLEPLMEISRRRGIPLIEDCAQAHGATYRGKGVGNFGLAGCFSFYPGKNLGAFGEGGAIVTNDADIASRMRALRDHAQRQRYHHAEIGFNYRMDGIQGAVLGVKLKHLHRWTETRCGFAERYLSLLAGLPIQLPTAVPDRRHVWHLFVVEHPDRDALRGKLESMRIHTGLHYPVPLHLQEAYHDLGYRPGDFPVAERIGRQCMTLPLFAEMSLQQQNAVVDALNECLA